jgi:phage terminase small subunit
MDTPPPALTRKNSVKIIKVKGIKLSIHGHDTKNRNEVNQMSRPSKSAKIVHPCSQTKEELRNRIETEDKIRGNSNKLEPSSRLNANQKKIFKYIVSELEASKILGNLDTFFLEMGAIAIDRLQCIEREINRDFSMIYSKELMSAKSKYSTDFLKFCQEACLSPQARAKMGILATHKQMEDSDPLLKVLKGKSG